LEGCKPLQRRAASPSGRFGGLQALQDPFFSIVLGGEAAENDRKSKIWERQSLSQTLAA
jgi:hypothetical protein